MEHQYIHIGSCLVPMKGFSRRFLLLLAFLSALLLAMSCSSSSGLDEGSDVSPPPPPPPGMDAISIDLVPASGGAQSAAFDWMQHHAVIGEPYVAGLESSAGKHTVRHGFVLVAVEHVPVSVTGIWSGMESGVEKDAPADDSLGQQAPSSHSVMIQQRFIHQ